MKILKIILFIVMGHQLMAQEYSIQLLPFNSNEYDEFSPVYYDDGVVFCSNKKSNIFINYISERTNKPPLDLYYVEQTRRNKWGKPDLLDKNFKTNYHDGPATFDERENLIFFTRNIRYERKIGSDLDRMNRLGLFYAEESRREWQQVKPFPYNSEEYNIAHPTLSSDGNTLYFTSDMDGGYGRSDLYVCYYENGKWSEPENLGSQINTEGDEVFPFIHQSGRLYFSSNGWDGAGRLDVFYSEQINGKWHRPIALEAPINSRYNDFGFIIDDFNKAGLFSSDRNRSEDIYSFVTYSPMFENMKKMERNNYCYIFFEEGTQNADTLSMKYEWDLGDGTKIRGVEVEHCYQTTGTYDVKLNVIDPVTGDVWFNEASYRVVVEDIEQAYIECPDTALVGTQITFDGSKTNLPDFDVYRYRWDFGDGRITIGRRVTHIYSTPGEYIVQLGVQTRRDREGNQEEQGVYRTIVVIDPKTRKK